MKSGSIVNFCDYDSGGFISKYKTDLTEKIQIIKKDLLPDDIVSSFLHKQYKTLDELIKQIPKSVKLDEKMS